MRFIEQGEVDAEAALGALRTGYRLKDQINRRALRYCLQRVGHMRQYARLRGNAVQSDHIVEQAQQVHERGDTVRRWVHANHRVARAVHQPIQNARHDALGLVRRMVGLQANGHAPGQTQGAAKARDHLAAAGQQDQILVAHQLAHGGHHFWREARCQGSEHRCGGCVREQPVAKTSHGQMCHGREGQRIVAVDNQARDFIGFIRYDGFAEKAPQRHIGQGYARRHALLGAVCGHACQLVPGTQRGGLGQ